MPVRKQWRPCLINAAITKQIQWTIIFNLFSIRVVRRVNVLWMFMYMYISGNLNQITCSNFAEYYDFGRHSFQQYTSTSQYWKKVLITLSKFHFTHMRQSLVYKNISIANEFQKQKIYSHIKVDWWCSVHNIFHTGFHKYTTQND